MAYGGGIWLTQNKVLPGTYINFISQVRAMVNLSDRGFVALGLELDWGTDEEVITIENADFQKSSLKILGYDYTSDKLKGLRDVFQNAKTLYLYKLNKGTKATNDVATARCTGIRGNDLTIVINNSVDEVGKFDVETLLDGVVVDSQTVANTGELVSNDYVDFNTATALSTTAGKNLSGGTNGTVTGADYQKFLDKIEGYYFNTIGCLSDDKTIKDLFIAFTKRMRDEVGAKFQAVLYRAEYADYEGVVSVENKVLDDVETAGVFWVTGAIGGCNVNASVSNQTYNGDFTFEFKENQTALANGIKSGRFLFHKADDLVKVLSDINTFTSVTPEKNVDFTSNQTIRVLDQIAIDIAQLFNKRYNGKVPNDNSGRTALWNDIVKHHEELQRLRAIENFADTDVTVEPGADKKSVLVTDYVTPVNAMEKLYMTVVVV